MEKITNNISFIFDNSENDMVIQNENITKLTFDTKKNEKNNYFEICNGVQIDFIMDNSDDMYILNLLLTHNASINGIRIEYDNSPNILYSIKSEEDPAYTDYDIKITNTKKNKVYVVFKIEKYLKKSILKYKKEDVEIVSEGSSLGNKHMLLKNGLTGALVFFYGSKAKIEKIDLQLLDPEYIVKCKRIELKEIENIWTINNEADITLLQKYINNRFDDIPKLINRINRFVINDIKTIAASRGYNLAYIHHYKYRINEEADMFNVLVEWSFGKKKD